MKEPGNKLPIKPTDHSEYITKSDVKSWVLGIAIVVVLIVLYVIGSRQPDYQKDAAPANCMQYGDC
jgi:hypothetical protein